MLLSSTDVLKTGLLILDIRFRKGVSYAGMRKEFKRHYGSSPEVLAAQFYDMQKTTHPVSKLTAEENNMQGFWWYLIAHGYLWAYHKNSSQLAQTFKTVLSRRDAYGEKLWYWIAKIAALKDEKIVWPEKLDDPSAEIFIISVDGVDFKIWEKKHPLVNQDRKMFSKKSQSAGLKYEIAISTYDSKCVWISVPFRCGKHALSVFQGEEDKRNEKLRNELGCAPYEALENKMKPGKLANADRGYRGGRGTATPNSFDPKDLAKFKSRGRARHETFNGRLKFYDILNKTFRHGVCKHKLAFEAVAVTVQYQMDHGAELFEVE